MVKNKRYRAENLVVGYNILNYHIGSCVLDVIYGWSDLRRGVTVPVYDYFCECGRTTEQIQGYAVTSIRCECGDTASRIISMSGVHTGNGGDTSWSRKTAEMFPDDSVHPEVREFKRNPTKNNMKRAMKVETLRFFEPGEKGIDRSKQQTGIPKDAMARIMQRNRRVEICST